MSCKNCGNLINVGENFCRKCGNKVETQSFEEKSPYLYQEPTNVINTDRLIEAYIGYNAKSIIDGGFSIPVLLFGLIYVLYRKMFGLAIVWYLIMILISIFIPILFIPFAVITGLYFSFKFNSMYLIYVKEKVEKIRYDNFGLSQEELEKKCKRKGGVSIFSIFLFFASVIGLIYLFALLSISISLFDHGIKLKDGYSSLGELYFKVPKDMMSTTDEKEEDSNILVYVPKEESELKNCVFMAKVTSNILFKDEYNYLLIFMGNDSINANNPVDIVRINGKKWHSFCKINDDGKICSYVHMKNDYIYSIDYIGGANDQLCQERYNDLISSVSFR